MKLARFTVDGKTRLGKVEDGQVVDLSAVAAECGGSMRQLLNNLEQLRPALEAVNEPSFSLADVRIEAPINDPQKFLAIGMNYKEHAQEAVRSRHADAEESALVQQAGDLHQRPVRSDLIYAAVSDKMDYEAEFGVVIGKRCRHVAAKTRASVIAGLFGRQ